MDRKKNRNEKRCLILGNRGKRIAQANIKMRGSGSMQVLTASPKRMIGSALESGFVILRKSLYVFRGYR